MTFTGDGDGDGEGDDSLSFEALVTALRFFGLLVFLVSINTGAILLRSGGDAKHCYNRACRFKIN